MTINEMHTGVRMEIDKSGTLDSVGFETIEIDYWLNAAITSLVKTKYSGSISTRGAFEQNQKRIDDLRTLVVETSLTTSTGTYKPYSFTATLPSSGPDDIYWFALGEEVDIAIPISTSTLTDANALVSGSDYYVVVQATHGGVTYPVGTYFRAVNTTLNAGTVRLCTTVRQGVTQVTADTYRAQIDNPYSEHILDNNEAKPLRLFIGDLVEFITDGNYGVIKYHLRYLKRASKVNILTTAVTAGTNAIQAFVTYLVTGGDGVTYNGVTYTSTQTFVGVVGVTDFTQVGAVSTITMYPTSSDLPEHTHDEIVKEAANMIIENIESPRYRTHSYEVRKTE
jgi:hypothetical protein